MKKNLIIEESKFETFKLLIKAKTAAINILIKYLDFAYVFSKKLAQVLLRYTKIKNKKLELKKDK